VHPLGIGSPVFESLRLVDQGLECYDTLTQNSTGDILVDCQTGKVHIYVNDDAYYSDFLHQDGLDHLEGLYYIGSLRL